MAVNEVWLKHRTVKIATCELKTLLHFRNKNKIDYLKIKVIYIWNSV